MDNLYDAVIVGGGPAGLSAAIYLARARYRVLVIEKDKIGGQITITADVVNYPGVASASGEAITAIMREQAITFGAEFCSAEVTGLDLDAQIRTVTTTAGQMRAFGVILAPGAQPRMVGFKGEAEFKGHGVAYCATCDGEFFTGLDVFVVGGGLAAAEEAIFLTKYARHVTMLVRRGEMSVPRSIAEKVEANTNITVRYNTVIDEVHGDSVLRGAVIRDTASGAVEQYVPPAGESFGVFVFAGYAPATEVLKGVVELTSDGYIVTDDHLKTARDGVYAAGDVRVKPLRQMVTACADGAIAATELERHIAAMQHETGLVPVVPAQARPAPPAEPETASPSTGGGFLTPDMKAQLGQLFGGMTRPVELRASLDDRPISAEVQGFLGELVGVSDKLSWVVGEPSDLAPSINVWCDGKATGLSFHGVPGGHEFNSFVIGLYNVGGPGQPIDDATAARIAKIEAPTDIKVLISLSCTMCPTTVMSVQHIAAMNQNVTAAVFDMNHFPDLRERYNVMSVPAMVVGDDVHFGKMAVGEVLDILGV